MQTLSHLILITYRLDIIINPLYREVTNLSQFPDPSFFNDSKKYDAFLKRAQPKSLCIGSWK